MAMSDYGCVIKKNGKKIVRPEKFMDMYERVGFNNEEMEDCCFDYLGDKDFCVGIYKFSLYVFSKGNMFYFWETGLEGSCDYENLPKLKIYKIDDVELKIKKVKDNICVVTFDYKGDKYWCKYGYGVSEYTKQWWKFIS